TTRNGTLVQMYFLMMLFFSGRIAPLELLPDFMRQVAFILPFRWIISFPIEVLLGWVAPQDALVGIGIQFAWVVALTLLAIGIWQMSVRRYSAVGG
ncbi:MAG TPA: ABC-2 family transporter protein, partial [Aggregatilineales bacterium]|nr:ABC-2 family transporter protein [Aggregatilineales bacterium]